MHAGIQNPGKQTVLVSVPRVEVMVKTKKKNSGADFLAEKISLIQSFSQITESPWIVIVDTFKSKVFNKHVGFPVQVLGLCPAAPFAYAMGIRQLIMGSGFNQEGDKKWNAIDGTHPCISDAVSFAGISFGEQDGISTRRSEKVRNIVSWCKAHGKKIKIQACFDDSRVQCGVCAKCVRTQLNLLAAKANPRDWGFDLFDEKRFTRFVRRYGYWEAFPSYLWDTIDTIEDNTTYPYCNELLHWLKETGYKTYFAKAKRVLTARNFVRCIISVHKYPYYVRRIYQKLTGRLRP